MKQQINGIHRMQQLAGIITESQLNEIDDNQLIENIENLTEKEIHAVTMHVGGEDDKALEGLLSIIKKVNPQADLEKKKMSLERAWNETSEDIRKTAMKGWSAASSVRKYFLDNLQIFR
jgi:hypothetical protein